MAHNVFILAPTTRSALGLQRIQLGDADLRNRMYPEYDFCFEPHAQSIPELYLSHPNDPRNHPSFQICEFPTISI